MLQKWLQCRSAELQNSESSCACSSPGLLLPSNGSWLSAEGEASIGSRQRKIRLNCQSHFISNMVFRSFLLRPTGSSLCFYTSLGGLQFRLSRIEWRGPCVKNCTRLTSLLDFACSRKSCSMPHPAFCKRTPGTRLQTATQICEMRSVFIFQQCSGATTSKTLLDCKLELIITNCKAQSNLNSKTKAPCARPETS